MHNSDGAHRRLSCGANQGASQVSSQDCPRMLLARIRKRMLLARIRKRTRTKEAPRGGSQVYFPCGTRRMKRQSAVVAPSPQGQKPVVYVRRRIVPFRTTHHVWLAMARHWAVQFTKWIVPLL